MRTTLKLSAILVCALVSVSSQVAAPDVVAAPAGPALKSIGPLAVSPDGVLFAGDKDAAAIFALELGAQAAGRTPGTADVPAVDQKIAAALGTAPAEITITDLAVHPKSRNTFVSVMRGQGTAAQPALVRIDGAGAIDLVNLEPVTFTSVNLPNPAAANPTARSNPRTQAIMDLGFVNGRLIVAGLSNEEFASKLWSVAYPFAGADRGTSVEIFHGNHGRLETHSPIFSFVPYAVGSQPHIIAGYLCTPLVKIPMSALQPGQKVLGTTIAELGAGNRPIDMVLYSKGGQDFLLMSNTSRGVMKIPTDTFAGAPGITEKVPQGTAGVPFETLAELKGVEHLDRVGADKVAVLAKADTGLSLRTIPLP